MKRVRLLCLAAAALLTALAIGVPAIAKADQSDADANRSVAWSGLAQATGIHQTLDSEHGVLPVKSPFYGDAPDAESDWGNDYDNARASTYYPGPTATYAVNLICDQVAPMIFAPDRIPPSLEPPVCNPSPTYPLSVQATATKPDVRTDTSQQLGTGAPVTQTATSAVAHADRNSVQSDSVITGFRSIGLPSLASSSLAFRKASTGILHGPAAAAATKAQPADSDVLKVDEVTARTKQTYGGDNKLTSHAETTLKGISLLGGNIQIASLFATSTTKTDGQGFNDHDEHVTLGGVTVAGQPAAIDDTGIHISSSSTPVNKQLNQALAQLLGSSGAQLRLLTTGSTTTGYEAQGLLFSISEFLPIPNATDTYFMNFTLGTAGTGVTASPDRNGQDNTEAGGIGGLSGSGGSVGSTGGSVDTGSSTPGSFSSSSSPASFSSTRRGASPRVLGRRQNAIDQLGEGLIGHVIAWRFELLYLGFTLAFIGLCLSSRLLVPRAGRPS